jgi:Uma2 family endonuclease
LASTTWQRPEVQRSIEADDCFLLTQAKLAAARHRTDELAKTLAPDLAIEIDLRRSAVDRREIYATLGVSEVWRFNGEALRIDLLTSEGTYELADASQFLPITAAEIEHWLLDVDSTDETEWTRELREWVRAEVVPRRNG